MSGEGKAERNEPAEESATGARDYRSGSDDLVQFVRTKGTQVAGKYRDKAERIAETVCDLELACEGAASLGQKTGRGDRGRWGAALARACSVFLRKMVIGDRNNPATRLLDNTVVGRYGIGFDRLRRIPSERRTIEICKSFPGGMMELEKLNEATGCPEATISLPIAPHSLRIAIQWPLPGVAGWTAAPTEDRCWRMSPGELFDFEGKEKLDCSGWLGQQLVMFDQRGITLKDVIRTVATYEGAHSINVSRLLQAEDKKTAGPFNNPERHILDNVTVFGMKYTHIVVIECALYVYEMLADGGHIERQEDEKGRLRPSFVTLDGAGFFSAKQDWLGFAGGLILAIGTVERSIAHMIRPVG